MVPSRWAASRTATALLLLSLLLPVSHAAPTDACEHDASIARTPPLDCITLRDVCIDQQQFITYEPQFQPWNSDALPPTFSVKDLTFNWPNSKGNGDRYTSGWNLHYPPVTIRPNSSEEACADTRQPALDPCTTPLILWARWPYNLAEAFATVYTKLWTLVEAGSLSRRLLPVLATPNGLRAPRYLTTLLGPLFERRLQTLAGLSRRPDNCGHDDEEEAGRKLLLTPASAAAPPGVPAGRCFRTAHLCRLRNRDVTSVVPAAQSLVRHFAPLMEGQEQATPAPGSHTSRPPGAGSVLSGAGPEVLRVVVALRPGAESRSLLNADELLALCNAWAPPASTAAAPGPGGAGGEDGSPGGRTLGSLQQQQGQDPGWAGSWRGLASRAGEVMRWRPGSMAAPLDPLPLQRRLVADPIAPAGPHRPRKELEGTLEPGPQARPSGMAAAAAAERRLSLSSDAASSAAPAAAAWRSAACVGHVFGSGPGAMLRDMALMGRADVLVCLHGAACLNAYFLPNGSSLVEVRPLGMNKRWANDYFFKPLLGERGVSIFWYGVDIHNASNSAPSLLEEQKSGLLNEKVRHRERHVRLPWAALRHHLDLIAHVGRDPSRYRQAYRQGGMYVTDELQAVPVRPKMPEGAGWK